MFNGTSYLSAGAFCMRLHTKFAMFCFVGGLAFLIDWSFFNLFYGLGFLFEIAIVFSWMISMVFNFSINRNITFSARGFDIKKQILKWVLVYLIAFLARLGGSKLVLILLGETIFNANIAFIVGIIISIPISFLGSLLWAFKKR